MVEPWTRCLTPPEVPDPLPVPPPELALGAVWHRHLADDGAELFVAFTGDGRPPASLYVGWLYCLPPEGEFMRAPTFEELYAASARCDLEGIMWELPTWFGGHKLPESTVGIMVHFRQKGAVDGSPAANRFRIAAGVIGAAGIVSPPN